MENVNKIACDLDEKTDIAIHCLKCDKLFFRENAIVISKKLENYFFIDLYRCCNTCLAIEVTEAAKKYKSQHRYNVKLCLDKSNIPVSFARNYDPKKGNSNLLDFVVKNSNKSLFISSSMSGKCKTRTVLKVACDLLDEKRLDIKFYLMSQLLRKIMGIYSDNIKEADDTINRLCDLDILIIDDFGKEKLTDRAGEVIFEIIDRRILSKKRTWITSNYSGREIIERLGERGNYFVRRIKEYYKIINAGD